MITNLMQTASIVHKAAYNYLNGEFPTKSADLALEHWNNILWIEFGL